MLRKAEQRYATDTAGGTAIHVALPRGSGGPWPRRPGRRGWARRCVLHRYWDKRSTPLVLTPRPRDDPSTTPGLRYGSGRSPKPDGRRAGVSGTWRSLVAARRAYRRLWLARTISQCGDVVQFTTLGLLVLHLTGSALGVSAVVVAEVLPVLLLAPLAGAVADRYPRVRVMVAADLFRVALAATLAVAHQHVAGVYLVAAGLAAGNTLFSPAAQSLLPSLVDDDELVTANAGIWTAAVSSQILLAPAAAFLAVRSGFTAAFAVNAASFALSALALRGLAEPAAARPVSTPSLLAHAGEGLRALAALPLLRSLAVVQLLAALSAGATSALLVVLAEERLNAPDGFGLLLAAIAAGAISGPLLLRRVVADPLRPAFVFGPFALRGIVDLVLAAVTALPLAAAALVAYGIGTSTGSVTFTSLIQARVPERLRGRAFAGLDMLWQTGRLTSLLAGGLLADAYGIRAVYLLGGILLLAAAALGAVLSRGAAAELTSAPNQDQISGC